MGQSGSDVAKDASDIVLTDDNFASIVAAIEEGRRIFDNIQKFVLHVLAENIAQAGTLLIGLAFKDPNNLSVFPLAPVEIVWIIMITSGLPDMGLGFERAVPDIMRRPPQSLKTGIFTWEFCIAKNDRRTSTSSQARNNANHVRQANVVARARNTVSHASEYESLQFSPRLPSPKA